MATYYPSARCTLSVVFDGFGDADKPAVFADIPPKSFNAHLNSYKEADTWEVSFDSRFFPFSPELIRSAAVEIYVQHATDLAAPFLRTEESLIVTGLVDKATLIQGAEGAVSFEGRDYTALLLDRIWDPSSSGHKGRVPVGEALDGVVQTLVDEAVGAATHGRTLTVEFVDGTSTVRTTCAKRSPRKKRGTPVKADSTYWDVIYKLCLSMGYIVFVRGWKVVIARPHVLQVEALDRTYRVAYGRNLETLEVERALHKEAVPQIRVRSHDPVTRAIVEGRYPLTRAEGLTGVGTKRDEYRVMTVPDCGDVHTLRQIARTAYDTIARGEGTIHFATKHLLDLPDSAGTQRDLLALRAGDPVQIQWDAFNAEALANMKSETERVGELLARGYSYDVAKLVAEKFTKLDYFRQPFYVKEVNLTWDARQGLKLAVEAVNFINVPRDTGEAL